MNDSDKKNDWDPGLYLRFRDERTRPSVDLVGRIQPGFEPQNILDVGCGPGNSGEVLIGRWPRVRLVGIDTSSAMIAQAKKEHPDQEWVAAAAQDFEISERFDIVFSNATIQWIPRHKKLLAHLSGLLTERGVIAIQIPLFTGMSVSKGIDSVSAKKRWKKRTAGCARLFTYHRPDYYYNALSRTMKTIDMWQTDYYHVMESHASIVAWIRATALKPYLELIESADDKAAFEGDVLDEIKKRYPREKDGRVLFPFRRLFFIAYRT